MADPLADAAPQTALADPLAGWQPSPSAPASDTPPPAKPPSILNSSWSSPGKQLWGALTAPVDDQRIHAAFGEAYNSTMAPSISREGIRSFLTPELQQKAAEHWWGPAANVASDLVGTGAADVAGIGNSIYTLGNEGLSFLPDSLRRDLNVELSQAPFAPELRVPPVMAPQNAPAPMREIMAPPTPSVSDVWKQQRAATPPDQVTSAINTLLRRNTGTTDIPPPPAPFTPIAQPPPPPRPSPAPGGLLNIPPAPGSTPLTGAAPTMTADEMLARSQGYYSPADKQAAQGAMIKSDAADTIRGVLTDTVPSDPQKAAAVGNTPLVQLGKDYQPFQGQPMSFDTAMALDRRLTAERQAALRSGNNTLASQLDDAQGKIRDNMQSLGSDDTTGDPSALANLAQARQAYAQYVKQSQLEDLQYRASLLPDDKQNAYVRSQATSMLRGNQTRNWTDDERGVLEQAVKSGNIGTMGNVGISLIKPFSQGTGATLGGSVFGTPGAIVGGQIGGEVGTGIAARVRAALNKITLDNVSQQISQGVPPPPPGVPPSAPGGWRPVNPGEVFQPGRQFRMNQTTGRSEVYGSPGQ